MLEQRLLELVSSMLQRMSERPSQEIFHELGDLLNQHGRVIYNVDVDELVWVYKDETISAQVEENRITTIRDL